MNNKKLYLIIGGVVLVIFFVVVFLIVGNIGGGTGQKVTLSFWGVYDDRNAFERVIQNFQTANPSIKIIYTLMPYEGYEQELVNALAAGTGPDIFMIQHTWLPKHGDKLVALPAKIPGEKQPLMTAKSFRDQYVDVAYDDLVQNDQIYALPLYVDTLGLYYNRDLFNTANITRPPQNWDEFNTDVELLTKLDSYGNIIQSGATIGTAKNINRSTDILMSLMLQSGTNMVDTDRTQATFGANVDGMAVGERALKYYTDFANPAVKTYCWNDSQHYSVDAFTEGTAAMMINYSHQVANLNAKASKLNFGIAPLPQISNTDIKNYANYWAVAVANKSQSPNEAWKFITYLTSKEGATAYLADTNRPSARRDILELQKQDDNLDVFASQALTAKSWYQVDAPSIETIFANMIDDVNFHRQSTRDAIQSAESKVSVLMSQQRNRDGQ
ncbi:MAG: Extracellular solute-binding protein family 1 [Candidatus Yanofskybacteria bacterium GW2011_GWD2_39_48]|uniref:Extracellular solute-binding protein family 1 n=1 Tax=Candidatus Yanofskybacteria bacterium GW2011_GWD2_39_48 TaxID=1619031 RepID=A0A0G0RMB5_9BACT|nr:MAG: Extracellular solute-binding protein family 1 [Candidatus Yanofskybacteria bacterium GW2011_GWD2_39_48]